MDQEQLESAGRELAAALAREIADGRSKKWRCPGELKSKIVAYSQVCRERGETLGDIAGRLGLVESTLARWLRREKQRPTTALTSPGFQSVSIVPSEAGSFPESGTPLTLVTPHGYRIEGLDLAAVAHLLGSLG